MSRVVIEDCYRQNARLGCCVWATSRDLAGHVARVFGHDFAERVALDRPLCPTLTLSFSLTRSSTNPPWVARTVCPAVAIT